MVSFTEYIKNKEINEKFETETLSSAISKVADAKKFKKDIEVRKQATALLKDAEKGKVEKVYRKAAEGSLKPTDLEDEGLKDIALAISVLTSHKKNDAEKAVLKTHKIEPPEGTTSFANSTLSSTLNKKAMKTVLLAAKSAKTEPETSETEPETSEKGAKTEPETSEKGAETDEVEPKETPAQVKSRVDKKIDTTSKIIDAGNTKTLDGPDASKPNNPQFFINSFKADKETAMTGFQERIDKFDEGKQAKGASVKNEFSAKADKILTTIETLERKWKDTTLPSKKDKFLNLIKKETRTFDNLKNTYEGNIKKAGSAKALERTGMRLKKTGENLKGALDKVKKSEVAKDAKKVLDTGKELAGKAGAVAKETTVKVLNNAELNTNKKFIQAYTPADFPAYSKAVLNKDTKVQQELIDKAKAAKAKAGSEKEIKKSETKQEIEARKLNNQKNKILKKKTKTLTPPPANTMTTKTQEKVNKNIKTA